MTFDFASYFTHFTRNFP